MKKNVSILCLALASVFFTACNDDDKDNNTSPAEPRTVTIVEGALPGIFSVSEEKSVQFSRGNLIYSTQSKSWKFAFFQTDRIGTDNEKIFEENFKGSIDLFGWATSGCKYEPTLISGVASDYTNDTEDFNGSCFDWGNNVISNGGKSRWYTMDKQEWDYLLNKRENANHLYSVATINNVRGLILLPDNWNSSIAFQPQATSWETNTYDTKNWYAMENDGAVFLPTCGNRLGTVSGINDFGSYWTAAAHTSEYSYSFSFSDTETRLGSSARMIGLAVRLVKLAK